MNVQGPAGAASGHPQPLVELPSHEAEETALQAAAASSAASQQSFLAALQAVMGVANGNPAKPGADSGKHG